MAFASGTFSLYTPGNPVVTGTTIQSSWANNTLTDIATGLTTCVLKDGTQTITANLPMSGFKFTGLGAGNAAGNSLRYEQLFSTSAITLLGPLRFTVATGLAATGTVQGNALEVTSVLNTFSTVASGTGAKLSSTAGAGEFQTIYNGGANALTIYPQTGSSINQLAANAGMLLPINTVCRFDCTSATQWIAILSR